MGDVTTKTWTVTSTMGEVIGVLKQIVEMVTQAGFRKEAVFAVRLALDEALANAVKHGNQNDPSRSVKVEVGIDDAKVTISIEDEGAGFDPVCLPDPTSEENITRPCGRGVMLMKAYMTQVSFNERGNRVTLVKTHNCNLPQD